MEANWVDAEGGYSLALDANKIRCRNKKGKVLATVPAKVRKSEPYEQLAAVRDFVAEHQRDCRDQVERWMLRTLPVPASLIASVWRDPAWRRNLEDLVVFPMGDPEGGGFLRGADTEKGIGVVDLDGESSWLDAAEVCIAHPILLSELDEWRELAADLEVTQGVSQLHRETFARPEKTEGNSVKAYAEGKFEQLRHVLGKCRTLGFKVSGGFAVCPVWEDGRVIEARFWIGSEDPEYETHTGDLIFTNRQQQTLPLAEVSQVAWSEGHRMAALIYAARHIETPEGEA